MAFTYSTSYCVVHKPKETRQTVSGCDAVVVLCSRHMTPLENVLYSLKDNYSPGRANVSRLPVFKAMLVRDQATHMIIKLIQRRLVTLYKY